MRNLIDRIMSLDGFIAATILAIIVVTIYATIEDVCQSRST